VGDYGLNEVSEELSFNAGLDRDEFEDE